MGQRGAVGRRLQRLGEHRQEAVDVAVVVALADRVHPQVEAGELRRDHRDVIASSELSRIGLIEPALWIFSAVPSVPKQERNVFTSEAGVGASPTIASRKPWPLRPAACSGAIP